MKIGPIRDANEHALEVFESYMNGNISRVKAQLKDMDKYEFLTFIEIARGNGIMPFKFYKLVENTH